MFHDNTFKQAFLVSIIVGQQPAISTVINTRVVPLTAAYANCIQCETLESDVNSDTETKRPSSKYAVCGDANTLNTFYKFTNDIPGIQTKNGCQKGEY